VLDPKTTTVCCTHLPKKQKEAASQARPRAECSPRVDALACRGVSKGWGLTVRRAQQPAMGAHGGKEALIGRISAHQQRGGSGDGARRASHRGFPPRSSLGHGVWGTTCSARWGAWSGGRCAVHDACRGARCGARCVAWRGAQCKMQGAWHRMWHGARFGARFGARQGAKHSLVHGVQCTVHSA